MIRIGKHLSNDFILNDRASEDFHCEIKYKDGAFWVIDNKTRYGTLVNGKRIDKMQLNRGDEMQVGFARVHWEELLGLKSEASETLMLHAKQEVQQDDSTGEPIEITFPRGVHTGEIEKTTRPEEESTRVAVKLKNNPYRLNLAPALAQTRVQQTSEPETDIPAWNFNQTDSSGFGVEPTLEKLDAGHAKPVDQRLTRFNLSDDERLLLITLGLMAVMALLGLLIGNGIEG